MTFSRSEMDRAQAELIVMGMPLIAFELTRERLKSALIQSITVMGGYQQRNTTSFIFSLKERSKYIKRSRIVFLFNRTKQPYFEQAA